MNQFEFGAFTGAALAFLVWAVFMEIRFHALQSQLIVAKEEKKDAEIDAKNRALSDDDINAKLQRDFGGGDKPPT